MKPQRYFNHAPRLLMQTFKFGSFKNQVYQANAIDQH